MPWGPQKCILLGGFIRGQMVLHLRSWTFIKWTLTYLINDIGGRGSKQIRTFTLFILFIFLKASLSSSCFQWHNFGLFWSIPKCNFASDSQLPRYQYIHIHLLPFLFRWVYFVCWYGGWKDSGTLETLGRETWCGC